MIVVMQNRRTPSLDSVVTSGFQTKFALVLHQSMVLSRSLDCPKDVALKLYLLLGS